TIAPTHELPHLTGTVTIDGYSNPETTGARPNDLPVTETNADGDAGTDAILSIQLSGVGTAGQKVNGLSIEGQDCVIAGLVINEFEGAGIAVLRGGDHATIRGSFIGTDPAGLDFAANGGPGVLIDGSWGNLIGGPNFADSNLISGNGSNGVRIT